MSSTILRPSIGSATWITALVAPLFASLLLALSGGGNGTVGADFVTVALFTAAFAMPFTLIGLFLVGWPLTFFAERWGAGKAWPIVTLNGAVAALGFALAFRAEWPMMDLQQMVWLTMAFSALLFTLLYLRGGQQEDRGVHA